MNNELLNNLQPLLPELQLLGSAIVLLLFGVYGLKRVTPRMVLAIVLALSFTLLLIPMPGAESVIVLNGMVISDGYTAFAKFLIVGGAIMVLLISSAWLTEDGGQPFEYLLLILFAVLGMMLMVSANNLLALYMGLELSSLALYVLAAFQRDNARSSEAGLKYFVLGALASGMMLYGTSLVYGFAGSTGFEEIAAYTASFSEEAANGAKIPAALTLGVVLLIIGFCFKVAAVPFHMWTPDVYEGAPTSTTAFFAIASKIAAFALFARVLLQPFADIVAQWQQIIVFVSFASMAVGALAALRQTNIKRLLAYSSIGHAGFMLMGLATGTESGVQAMLVYLALYLFMSAGAFGCVLLMKRDGEYVEHVSDLAGLSRSRPAVAALLAACMFSMIGIPPLAGFYGKLMVVRAAIESGLLPLAVAGLLTSVISCYYYLRVVKFMYFDEPANATPLEAATPFPLRAGLAISAAVTLGFFLLPSPLITQAKAAAGILLQ